MADGLIQTSARRLGLSGRQVEGNQRKAEDDDSTVINHLPVAGTLVRGLEPRDSSEGTRFDI